jgi:hypothetical protein
VEYIAAAALTTKALIENLKQRPSFPKNLLKNGLDTCSTQERYRPIQADKRAMAQSCPVLSVSPEQAGSATL